MDHFDFPALRERERDETQRTRRRRRRAGEQADAPIRGEVHWAFLAVSAISAVVALEHALVGMWAIAASVAVASIASLGLAAYARRAPNVVAVGEAGMVLYWLIVTGSLMHSGGFVYAGGWLCALPVAAAILGAPVALRWTVIAALTAGAFLAGHGLGWFQPGLGSERPLLHLLTTHVGALVVVGVLVQLFLRHHAQVQAQALAANRDLAAQTDRLRMLALLDPLTALPNRTLFDRCLARAMRRQPTAVIYVDLDGFKEINDVHGHAAGDALLRQVGRRLQGAVCRGEGPSLDELEHDYVGPLASRRSGDEYTVMVPGRKLPEMVHTLRRIFDRPFRLDDVGTTVRIAGSIGVAHPGAHLTAEEALSHADAALYRAKRSTSEDVAFFDSASYARVQRKRLLRDGLRGALERGEMRVVFQPLHAAGGELVGAEALLRWNSPVLGEVPPAEFIPVAETSGQILELGDFVLREACAEAADWEQPIRVSVNVSAVQLGQPRLCARVREILRDTGLSPSRLELEVTESMAADDMSGTVEALAALRALGLSVALDDFGTGYSSLHCLRRLPVDRLKIDRSFVSRMLEDEGDQAVVRTIVAMGRSLGLEMVAEGVETEPQLAWLRSVGCHEVQGWLFGRPTEADEMRRVARAGGRRPKSGRASVVPRSRSRRLLRYGMDTRDLVLIAEGG